MPNQSVHHAGETHRASPACRSGDARRAAGAGHGRRRVATALRSFFRALKRERVIFRNPARGLPVGDIKGIPRSIPSELLMGSSSRRRHCSAASSRPSPTFTRCPARRSGPPCTPRVWISSRGTLEVRRGLLRHALHPEELTTNSPPTATGVGRRRPTPTCWSARRGPSTPTTRRSAPAL